MRGREREAVWDQPRASLRDGSGPTRTYTNTDEDPEFKRRPVGFAPPPIEGEE